MKDTEQTTASLILDIASGSEKYEHQLEILEVALASAMNQLSPNKTFIVANDVLVKTDSLVSDTRGNISGEWEYRNGHREELLIKAAPNEKNTLEPIIGVSCRSGEAGEVCTILDEYFCNPSELEKANIKDFVNCHMPMKNADGVNPESIFHGEKGWSFG